jgi:ABC-type cobalt transport system substrate-binding protein
MRKVSVVAVIIAGLALGACSESDEDQVKGQIEDAYTAFADGEAEDFCGKLSSDYRPDFEDYYGPCTGETLSKVNDALSDDQKEQLADPSVTDIKLSGDQADATVNGEEELEVVKEDGEWKLDDFDPPK